MSPHKNDPADRAQPELPQASPQTGNDAFPPDDYEQGGTAEELTYDPVLPKQTVTVSVHCHIGDCGRPLPYPQASATLWLSLTH